MCEPFVFFYVYLVTRAFLVASFVREQRDREREKKDTDVSIKSIPFRIFVVHETKIFVSNFSAYNFSPLDSIFSIDFLLLDFLSFSRRRNFIDFGRNFFGKERFRRVSGSVRFLPPRIDPHSLDLVNTNTLKRQKGMWGSESVCQRSHVSLRGVLPSPGLCRE